MTLMELKDCVIKGIVPSEFLILVSKDNKFLANQYVQAISKLVNGELTKIKSIYEPQQSSISLLTASENAINILYVDTFDERAEDYSQFSNTIVVCDQIDKSISKSVEDYTIKLPKLEAWQICDYAKLLCPGLADDDIQWLVNATNNDIERVVNELSKVSIFNKVDQPAIFSSIRFNPKSDLYKTDLFAVVNALVDGDMPVLFDFLTRGDCDSLEPVMLANRTLTSLKNIILVSQNRNLTAEDCGVSAGQYRFINNKYRSLNITAVRNKIKFLSEFDLKLKTSKLELSKRDMLSYLLSNLCYKIT